MNVHRDWLLQWHGRNRATADTLPPGLFKRVEKAIRDEREEEYIKLSKEIKGAQPYPVYDEPLTHLQESILENLDGIARKVDDLAAECRVDRSRLYGNKKTKKGGITELKELGKVIHKHGVGYYRPDAPP